MKPAKMVRKHIANKVSAIAASMIRDHEKADMVCELAGQPAMFQFLDVAKDRVTAGELTQLQKEYRAFFLELLAKFGAASPSDLKDEQKKEFYKEIRDKWATGEGVSKNKMVDQPKEGNDGEGEGEAVKQAAGMAYMEKHEKKFRKKSGWKPREGMRKATAADLGMEAAESKKIINMTLKDTAKFLWENRKNKQRFYVTGKNRGRTRAPILVKPWVDDGLNIKVDHPKKRPEYAHSRKEFEAILADLLPRDLNDVTLRLIGVDRK